MFALKKTVSVLALLSAVLLSACSGSTGEGQAASVYNPDVKHSFALRQGRFSAITGLVADHQGYVYAAGFSDQNCVLVKLDAELKTLIKMVRFGSAQGGSYFSQDNIKDMAVDSQNNLFVTGYTQHKDFPVTPGSHDVTKDGDEIFVVKFSSDLKMLASTFIGGDPDERAFAIAVDGSDNVYVAGFMEGTRSQYRKAFVPPAGAYDRRPAPDYQAKAFVAKLSNDLVTLQAATLLGGDRRKQDGGDKAYDLAVDADGAVWVVGQTQSEDFPVTTGCLGGKMAGKSDAFVAKFDADLKHLLASTFLGGRKNERARAIVADGLGHVFVGGWSESADMLMFLEGYDTEHSGNEEDGFIVKLDDRLGKIVSATFLGGERRKKQKGGKTLLQGDDKVTCLVLSDDGRNLYAAGRTESRDFETTPPSRKAHDGNIVLNIVLDRSPATGDRTDKDYGDGFIAKFDRDLTTCVSSTLFGGSSLDYIDDLLIQGDDLFAGGETYSLDFPGMNINYGINGTRGFVSRLNSDLGPGFDARKPIPFKPQFTDAELKKIGDGLLDDHLQRLADNDMYDVLGRYAKSRISREQFEAKVAREFFLYGNPFTRFLKAMKAGLKFHHHDYYQNGMDGYDWIELYYSVQSMGSGYWGLGPYYNPNAGRFMLKLIAKKKKWQLVDFEFRGFSPEDSRVRMQKRLL